MTRRTLGLIGGFAALLVAGCMEPSAKKLHEDGIREYQAGAIINAQGMFEEALKKDPEHYESAFYAGMCHKAVARNKLREEDYAGAMRELDMSAYYFGLAIESYPGYMAAIQQKAEVLEMKGQYEDAVRLAIWAKDNVGTDRGQLIMLAQKLAEGGDYDNALIRLRQAVALNPDDAYANAELGRFYIKISRQEEGIEALQRAYRINPSEPGVVDMLAELGYAPLEEDAPPMDKGPIHDIKEGPRPSMKQ